jgi:hypothetical protein
LAISQVALGTAVAALPIIMLQHTGDISSDSGTVGMSNAYFRSYVQILGVGVIADITNRLYSGAPMLVLTRWK